MPNMSRRRLIAGIVAAGGVVGAAPAGAEVRQTLNARVAWCNRMRKLLAVRAEQPGAATHVITCEGEEEQLRALRPGSAVTLSLVWRPDLDALAPWCTEEVICATGERIAARAGVA